MQGSVGSTGILLAGIIAARQSTETRNLVAGTGWFGGGKGAGGYPMKK